MHSLTVRLPDVLIGQARDLARNRHTSLSAVMKDALEEIVKAEERKRLYDDFTLLGEDEEMSSVEFAFAAQAEVVLRDSYEAE